MSDPAKKGIAEDFDEGCSVDRAMESSVREALRRHKQLGQPIVIARNGEVVWIPADEIDVPVEPSKQSSRSNR